MCSTGFYQSSDNDWWFSRLQWRLPLMTTPPRFAKRRKFPSKAASSWLMTFPSHGVSRESLLLVFGLSPCFRSKLRVHKCLLYSNGGWLYDQFQPHSPSLDKSEQEKISKAKLWDWWFRTLRVIKQPKFLHWKDTWRAWTANCFGWTLMLFNFFEVSKNISFSLKP